MSSFSCTPDSHSRTSVIITMKSWVSGSMMMLHRFFSTHVNLFTKAAATKVVIKEESIIVIQYIQDTLPTFRRLTKTRLSKEDETAFVDILKELQR